MQIKKQYQSLFELPSINVRVTDDIAHWKKNLETLASPEEKVFLMLRQFGSIAPNNYKHVGSEELTGQRSFWQPAVFEELLKGIPHMHSAIERVRAYNMVLDNINDPHQKLQVAEQMHSVIIDQTQDLLPEERQNYTMLLAEAVPNFEVVKPTSVSTAQVSHRLSESPEKLTNSYVASDINRNGAQGAGLYGQKPDFGSRPWERDAFRLKEEGGRYQNIPGGLSGIPDGVGLLQTSNGAGGKGPLTGAVITASEVTGVSNLDPENSNPAKTRSVRWWEVVRNPGRFYWPVEWAQQTFHSGPSGPWFSSPQEYEKAHGVTGIAGHYQLPDGITHDGLEALAEKEKGYQIVARDMAEGGLPPYARTPLIHAQGEERLPDLVKIIDDITVLNPALKAIRYDRTNREQVTQVLQGINYDFNVDDIDHFVNLPEGMRAVTSRKTYADLYTAVEMVGDLNWVPAPATMKKIISQSPAAQAVTRALETSPPLPDHLYVTTETGKKVDVRSYLNGAYPMTQQTHPELMEKFLNTCETHGLTNIPRIYATPNATGACALPEHNMIMVGHYALANNTLDEQHYMVAHETGHILAGHIGASVRHNEWVADRLAVQMMGSSDAVVSYLSGQNAMRVQQFTPGESASKGQKFLFGLARNLNRRNYEKSYGNFEEHIADIQATNLSDHTELHQLIAQHNTKTFTKVTTLANRTNNAQLNEEYNSGRTGRNIGQGATGLRGKARFSNALNDPDHIFTVSVEENPFMARPNAQPTPKPFTAKNGAAANEVTLSQAQMDPFGAMNSHVIVASEIVSPPTATPSLLPLLVPEQLALGEMTAGTASRDATPELANKAVADAAMGETLPGGYKATALPDVPKDPSNEVHTPTATNVPEHAPAAHGNGVGIAMSLSMLQSSIEGFKHNGSVENGMVLGSAGYMAANDLTGQKLFGTGKIGQQITKVTHDIKLPTAAMLIPDLVMLANAQNTDQKIAAGANLGYTIGSLKLVEAASLGGPEAIAAMLAVKYVGERTITPALKIADGWWSKDQNMVAYGKEELKAGVNELSYKGRSLGGGVELVGNVVDGAGDVVKATGGLANNVEGWLERKFMSPEDARIHAELREAGVVIPNPVTGISAGDALNLAGDDIKWTGSKVEEFGSWVTDKTGWGASDRQAMRDHKKEAEALHEKYVKALHEKFLAALPESVKQANQVVETYNKAAEHLITLLNAEKSSMQELTVAKKEYDAQYKALLATPLYRSSANTTEEASAQMKQLLVPKITQDSMNPGTHTSLLSPQLMKEQQKKFDQKQQAETEFWFNPMTPLYKQSAATFHQQADTIVKAKREQHQAQEAQDSYGMLAKKFNKNADQINHCLEQMSQLDHTLATYYGSIQKSLTEKTAVPADSLEKISTQIDAMVKQREALGVTLEGYEKTLITLSTQHEHLVKTNHLYKTGDASKTLGEALSATHASIEKEKAAAIGTLVQQATEGLDALAKQVTAQTPATTPLGELNTASVATNEARLQALITQNPALADKDLQAQLLAEAAKLTAYYTKGIDANGKPVTDPNPKLRDGILDDQELQAVLAKMNETFKTTGVQLTTSTAPTFVASASAANQPKQL